MSRLSEAILFPIGFLFVLAWCKIDAPDKTGKVINGVLEALYTLKESVHMKKAMLIISMFIFALAQVIADVFDYWSPDRSYYVLYYHYPANLYLAHHRFIYIVGDFLEYMGTEIEDILREVSEIYITEVRELEGRSRI